MVTFLALVAIVFYLVFFEWKVQKQVDSYPLATLVFVTFSVLMITVTGFIGSVLPTKPVANEPVYLHSLNVDDSFSGRIFLHILGGAGNIESDKTVYYSTIVPGYKARYEPLKIGREKVLIDEGDYERPYMETYHYEFQESWYGLIGFFPHGNQKPVFYVPTGTIKEDYSLK